MSVSACSTDPTSRPKTADSGSLKAGSTDNSQGLYSIGISFFFEGTSWKPVSERE